MGRVDVPGSWFAGEVVSEGGKAKVRATPASDAALMKGRTKASAPRDNAWRTWWGVGGADTARRGRGTRVG